jgi:hypothetical protein
MGGPATNQLATVASCQPRRNKYNVAPAEARRWNGRTYGSRAEMLYAQELWTQRDCGAILEYIEQPRLWLGVALNVYVPDFFVVAKQGVWYVDVKGRETPKFAKDCKLWAEYGRHPLHIVKRVRGAFETARIIQPKGKS